MVVKSSNKKYDGDGDDASGGVLQVLVMLSLSL